jgi:hypothetical protein
VNPSIRQSKRAQRTTGGPIRALIAAALVVSFMLASFLTPPAAAGTASEYFPQTGQTVSDPFLSYWRVNGALKIFGYPISPARYELDPSTGKTLWVQWFERARFEYHPDNAPEYQIQLGLLGRQLIERARPVAPGLRQTVKVYLVGPNWQWNENGDGLVPIEIEVAPTKRVLRAAIEALLSLPKSARADGLINALADSQLRVDDVTLVDGKATISLSGQLIVAGTSAEAYATAQLQATARQFPNVKEVVVLVNGCRLPLGERGDGCAQMPR